MKISKLLNKKYFLFFLFFILSSETIANEPVDIWNIDKTKADIESNSQNDTVENSVISEESISVYDLNNNNNDNNQNKVLLENNLEEKISLYGLYDPDKNNLSIDMWSKSDGDEIKPISSSFTPGLHQHITCRVSSSQLDIFINGLKGI